MRRALPWLAAALAAAFFLWGSLSAIDRPGLQYDEVAFVNAALGADHPDQHFVHARFRGVVTKVFPYIGGLKSWLYAPVFAVFGVSPESIRVPAVLLALLAVALTLLLARRLLGAWPAAALAVVLLTDPVYATMTKADWGPVVLGCVMRAVALLAWFALLRTRSLRYAWVLGAALLLGIFNKIDFVWFVAAFGVAALAVYWRELVAIVRGRPVAAALPLVAFLALLGLMAVESILPARETPPPGAADESLGDRLDVRWELFRQTYDGSGVHGYMVGTPLETTTPAPQIYAAAVLVALIALAAWPLLRERLPGDELRLAGFLLLATLIVGALFVATDQVGGAHHAIQLWPLPQLLLVAIATLVVRTRLRPVRIAGGLAAVAAVAWLAVVQVAARDELVDAFRGGDAFTHVWTHEIYELADVAEAQAPAVDLVVAADWGLGPQVFALGDHALRDRFRDLPSQFSGGARDTAGQTAEAVFRNRRVLVMFHRDEVEIFEESSRAVRRVIHALGDRARVRPVYEGRVLRAYLVDDRPAAG